MIPGRAIYLIIAVHENPEYNNFILKLSLRTI